MPAIWIVELSGDAFTPRPQPAVVAIEKMNAQIEDTLRILAETNSPSPTEMLLAYFKTEQWAVGLANDLRGSFSHPWTWNEDGVKALREKLADWKAKAGFDYD